MASILEAIAAAASGLTTGLTRTRERKRSERREAERAAKDEAKSLRDYNLRVRELEDYKVAKNEIQEQRYKDLDEQAAAREARIREATDAKIKAEADASDLRKQIEEMRATARMNELKYLFAHGGRDLEPPGQGGGGRVPGRDPLVKEEIDTLQALAERSARLYRESRNMRLDRRYSFDKKVRAGIDAQVAEDSTRSAADEARLLKALVDAKKIKDVGLFDASGSGDDVEEPGGADPLPPLPEAEDREIQRRIVAAGIKPGSDEYLDLYEKAAEKYWATHGGDGLIEKYRAAIRER